MHECQYITGGISKHKHVLNCVPTTTINDHNVMCVIVLYAGDSLILLNQIIDFYKLMDILYWF